MKRIASFILCVALALFSTASTDSKEVKLIKGGVLRLCPSHTVEKMVIGFMGSPSWESGKSSDGQVFVNITGDITYHEKPVRAKLQFHINGNDFLFNALEMNGIPSPNILAIGMMHKMCESAK